MRTLINAVNRGSSWLDRWTDNHPVRVLIAAAAMVLLILGALCVHAAAIGRVVAAPLMWVQL